MERMLTCAWKDFEDWMQQEEISPETVKLFEEMKEELLRHRGKAMYRISKKARNSFPEVRGGHYPERIFVLSDIYCALLEIILSRWWSNLKKVTVVGRPTLGILDYSNCCTVDYGDYRLMFPTSRCLSLIKAKEWRIKVVEPDIEIPLESLTILKEMWIWTSVWS